MKCESEFKDAFYASELFCNTCGMDIGFEPIIKKQRKNNNLYCCIDCASIAK